MKKLVLLLLILCVPGTATNQFCRLGLQKQALAAHAQSVVPLDGPALQRAIERSNNPEALEGLLQRAREGEPAVFLAIDGFKNVAAWTRKMALRTRPGHWLGNLWSDRQIPVSRLILVPIYAAGRVIWAASWAGDSNVSLSLEHAAMEGLCFGVGYACVATLGNAAYRELFEERQDPITASPGAQRRAEDKQHAISLVRLALAGGTGALLFFSQSIALTEPSTLPVLHRFAIALAGMATITAGSYSMIDRFPAPDLVTGLPAFLIQTSQHTGAFGAYYWTEMVPGLGEIEAAVIVSKDAQGQPIARVLAVPKK